ncbi:hypothetical protein N9W79_02415 [bacterium]|nr:hypothetical protein [bacterium]
MKTSSQFLNILLALTSVIALSLHVSCGGGGGAGGGEVSTGAKSAASFEGASSIEASDNKWVLKWNMLNAEDVIYAIYKGPTVDAIDYGNTIATTDESIYTYTPNNFYAAEVTCFVVKVSNMAGDANESAQCTQLMQLQFNGVDPASGLESAGDGGWSIQWPAVNVPGVMYKIFNRSKTDGQTYDFESPMGIETQPLFQFSKEDLNIPREKEMCFLVRYEHDDLVPDLNEEEVCTPTAVPIEFEGIAQVKALSSLKRIEVKWKKAAQESALGAEKVTGYVIYANTDDALEELVIADNPAGLSLSGGVYTFTTSYPSGATGDGIPITVKAIDDSFREDSNTCTAIANLNSGNTSVTQDINNCDSDPTNDSP